MKSAEKDMVNKREAADQGCVSRETRKPFIKQFFRKNKTAFGVALVVTMIGAGVNLFLSWLIQQLVDVVTGGGAVKDLNCFLVMTVVLIGGLVLLTFFEYKSIPVFTTRAMRQYKDYAFKQLTKKSISAFTGENTATYISALSNDAASIEKNYLESIFGLISNSIMFVGAFALMLYFSPLLTLAAFLLSFLPVVASLLAGNRLADMEKKVSDRNESFMAALKDNLSGFSVVKSFQAEEAVCRLFSESNASVEKIKRKRGKLAVLIQGMGGVAGAIAQLGVMLVGAYLILADKGVTTGVVFAFVNLMNFVIMPIGNIPTLLANRKAAVALIDKLAVAVCANVREEGCVVPANRSCDITLKDVSFSYEDKEVLRGIETCFEAGKSYAIVGASGSGKSTLLNLLMAGNGGYEGEILYGEDEVKSIKGEALYEMVSMIQQNVFVFNSSIYDNITMFKEFAKEDVERAICLSGLDKLIAEKGADYLCGENGSALSGGEKQRISIARCLLRKTPILLVDEATAALDAETAHYVTNSILDLEGYTRIVVTHALDESLLKQYDSILTLKNGKIAENGTFEELMGQKGYFYSLYTVSQ